MRRGVCQLFQRMAVVATLLAASTTSWAQESAAPATPAPQTSDSVPTVARPVAKVFIEFEGGVASSEMAAVIAAFGKPELLPVRLHRPKQTIGLCPILQSELKLPTRNCTDDLIQEIVRLNADKGIKLDPNLVRARRGVILPAVQASVTEVKRVFNLTDPDDKKRLEQILKNPGWTNFVGPKVEDILNGGGKNDAPRYDTLVIKRIAWQFALIDAKRVAEATLIGRQLANANLSISVEPTAGFTKSKFSAADLKYQNWCEDSENDSGEGSFPDMVKGLYDTSTVVACEAGGAADEARPEVIVMDQPIAPHPDLNAALSDAPLGANGSTLNGFNQACVRRSYNDKRDHSALLSTIVAAGQNNYGFVGMAPNAKIRQFPWDKDTVLNNELKRFLEETWDWQREQVFLFASRFAPFPPKPDNAAADDDETRLATEIWGLSDGQWTDLLADDTVRLKKLPIAETVADSKLLLVVAAGQSADGQAPLKIQAETPMSPQNLGDLDNVLVVAACVDCAGNSAKLWANSNRSVKDADRRFVGVMAPGGNSIPTYVSGEGVTKVTGGTSAASAFAAGLAAKMTQCYPSAYKVRPEKLKERIILASRPVRDSVSTDHVAGGVIDPSVSMLDPTKTWLKLRGNKPARPVKFGKWCKSHLELQPTEAGQRDPLYLKEARRLTNLEGTGLVYQRSDEVAGLKKVKHSVRREAPAKPDDLGPVATVTYEGATQECAVQLNRMQDLFLDEDHPETGDCTAVPLCEDPA